MYFRACQSAQACGKTMFHATYFITDEKTMVYFIEISSAPLRIDRNQGKNTAPQLGIKRGSPIQLFTSQDNDNESNY